MCFTTLASRRNLAIGLLAILAALPLIYAQHKRDEPSPRGAPEPRAAAAPRAAPSRPPVERRAIVDRPSHGTLRHADTHVVQQPAAVRRDVDVHHRVAVHRDVEVDLDLARSRSWHHFRFGWRVDSLRAGCLRLLVNGTPYYYDDGIYYQAAGAGYLEAYPPVGAEVPELPDGAIELEVGNVTYYYAGGAFYVQQDGGYVVVAPPLGALVPELPPGAVVVSINGGMGYAFNGMHYRPVFVHGVTHYRIFAP